jgi:hypothetical protein
LAPAAGRRSDLTHTNAKKLAAERKRRPPGRGLASHLDRDPASIEITSFGLAEDLDRLKRLMDLGVARVVPMFPPERSDKVLPVIDRWAKLMQQVSG